MGEGKLFPPPLQENFLLSSNADNKHVFRLLCQDSNCGTKKPSTIYEMREAILKGFSVPD